MFGLFYHFRKDSKGVGKHILSIGLIVSLMVSSVASFQNVSAEDTNEQKEKTVVTTVKYTPEPEIVAHLFKLYAKMTDSGNKC